MSEWPVIAEPELRRRLALGDDDFQAYALRFLTSLGPRTYDDAALARALDYPWSRPKRSYLLQDGKITLLDDLDAAQRAEAGDRFTGASGAAAGRLPLLAFGSNAAPGALRRKLAHFADPQDRSVLVIAGRLRDFDVGAASRLAVYGSLPATLFASPGTAVRCAVLWVTVAQFTQLVWSELSYRLGRLHARFEGDDDGFALDDVLAFVSRFGAYCADGRPVALAAIPATGRTARALSQEQLLDHVAARVLGEGATAQTLVRAIHEDVAGVVMAAAPVLLETAKPFASERWTPFPGLPK